jgi:pimeloyl-ACP methyl ester carboxylesterase
MRDVQGEQTIHYTVEGEGLPVILVHGIASSLQGWASVRPDLLAAGFKVYALDLLGHGDSAKPEMPEQYNTYTVYRTFESWLENLQLEQPAALIGHSLGGYLSLRYSLHHPEIICAMVLIAPFFTPRQISSPVRWMVRRPSLGIKALSRIPEHVIHVTAGWEPHLGTRLPASARLQIAADLKRASPFILHILHSIPDLTPQLSNVHIPTQVIWGEKDLTLKPSLFSGLVAALPSAVGRGLPGQGHLPHIGQPTTVNRMILDFLQSRMLAPQEVEWQSN